MDGISYADKLIANNRYGSKDREKERVPEVSHHVPLGFRINIKESNKRSPGKDKPKNSFCSTYSLIGHKVPRYRFPK